MTTNSSCVAGYLDAQAAVKVGFVKLYKWPESDAEFLRSLSIKEEGETGRSSPFNSERSVYHESFASRQKYLRSYTFNKKETVVEKTKKWFKGKQKVKTESMQRCRRGYCNFLVGVHKFMRSFVPA